MKKLRLILKTSIIITLLISLSYSILFICAKCSAKIDIKNSNSIYMYDKDGKTFYEGNNGSKKWVSLDEINETLIKATIYSEDKNFYNHIGFDVPRIAKSVFVNLKEKDLTQGASTITQQFARNLFLTFDKTWERKIKEAWYAFKLENTYSKDEILEGYLNTINYGNGILGIENASLYYFNKHAKDLTIEESAMLAGIPKSPNNYSPLNNEKKAKERQKYILKVMLKNSVITKTEYEQAINKKLTYYGKKDYLNLNTIMYYQDAVIKELKDLKIVSDDKVKYEGLKIYTSLDVKAQEILENSITNNLEGKDELQTAAIMMIPSTGEIIALAGGKDYSLSQYNRAIQSKRQVGSTMKPILYYSALENGLTPATTFFSAPTTFKLNNNLTYSPNNYGNIYPYDDITMALAIAYSDNIYAIKTHLFLGENNLINESKKIGITSKLEANASLPLGTNEINLKEFTTAYSVYANTGMSVQGHLINKVEDGNGDLLYEYKDTSERILKEQYTFILSEMLSNTYNTSLISYTSPTCASIAPKLTKKYAIKSGTTDYDLLTMGYNKDITVGVWTGYDDNRKLNSKELKYSKNIWADTIENYLRDKENSWYEIPNNVVGVITDLNTGEIATKDSKLKTVLYYIKGTEPGYKNN